MKELTKAEIKEKMQLLDSRMMKLPVGQADAEYEGLENEYEVLAKAVWKIRFRGRSGG